MEFEIRQRARDEAFTNKEEEIVQKKKDNFREAKRLIAGLVFNGHGCCLGNNVCEKVKEINK